MSWILKRLNILLVALFFIVGIATVSIKVDAEEKIELKQEMINPGSFYYPAKRFLENTQKMFMFSKDAKFNFKKTLLKKRMSELKYLTNNRILSEIERGSQRFAYHAGVLVEENGEKSEKEKEEIKKIFKDYKVVLEELRDKFKSNSSFWLLLQQDIDTLNILTQKL